MGKLALVLAVLSYLLPVAAQVWLRSGPVTHGMFWLVMTAVSLVIAAALSGLATAFTMAAHRRGADTAIGAPVRHRLLIVVVAAPAILVALGLVAALAGLAA